MLQYLLLSLLVAPLFPFLYVVLRWRTGGDHEPGVGSYAALLYFRSAAILLALAGASNLAYGWISTTEVDEAMTRLSWGLLVGSAVIFGINAGLLYLYGRHPGLAPARRIFHGFVLVMSGLIAFAALVTCFVTLFGEAATKRALELRADQLKLYGAWTFFYLATYLLTAWRMRPAARPA